MSAPIETRVQTRSDLAWSIAVGGIGVVAFTAFLLFAWTYAATLFLVFAGALLGVALTAMTHLLQKVMGGPHALRLALVCVVLAGFLSGVVFLGGSTIARQAAVLSNTLKSQLVTVKTFLEQHGVDTSYLELGSPTAAATTAATADTPATAAPTPPPGLPKNLPSAGALASGGGAIVSQTLKLLLGTVSAVGNFFIVLFLGLSFAAQPSVYRKGLLALAPKKYRRDVTVVVDRISDTLERWLIAQMITMAAVFLVTWIGLSIIGIDSSFILGIQAGTAGVHPDRRRADRRTDHRAGEPCVRMGRRASAFVLFLGVHALESYILTPIIQRQALDIPPATLFAFQILLGVVFGLWGLALALPLMAIVKVIITYLREDGEERPPEFVIAGKS